MHKAHCLVFLIDFFFLKGYVSLDTKLLHIFRMRWTKWTLCYN